MLYDHVCICHESPFFRPFLSQFWPMPFCFYFWGQKVKPPFMGQSAEEDSMESGWEFIYERMEIPLEIY